MQPVADAAGVQLIHDTTHVEIAADPDRLLQVLTNLLSNAVKFSPPNSTVSVMMRPGLSGVTLSVIDQGRGIPADKLEAIFGRFQQVDASDSRQKGGSGLGLAICRTIVLQHSGRIWAERNPGPRFHFPRLSALSAARRSSRASRLRTRSRPGNGVVLLAERKPANRARTSPASSPSRLSSRLRQPQRGRDPGSGSRGGEAILLDTSLDGMNGWEILPKLRRVDPEARTPIVLLCVDRPQGSAALPGDAEGWVANRRSTKMRCSLNWPACSAAPAKRPASSWWKTTSTWLA